MESCLLIGLCGRSGSGKGYVSSRFRDLGFCPIDLDSVYRDMISDPESECLKEIADEFGTESILPNGGLNRKYISDIVFGDPTGNMLERLNSITHPRVIARAIEICGQKSLEGEKIFLLDAPALFESGADKLCAKIICVVAKDEDRIKRICLRDHISEDKAQARLSAQMSDSELISRSDYVLRNYGDDTVLDGEIARIAHSIRTELSQNDI